jgi:small subunit ribosomal protein S21
MIIVNVKSSDNIDKALKVLKSKIINNQQTKILQERKEYKKKSVRMREKLLKAIYKERKSKS